VGRPRSRVRGERLPGQVWILAGVGFTIAVGFGVMSPVLPVYARMFGVSSFLVGLVVSSLSILRLATMPASSWLMRFTGPKEMAVAGNLLVALTTFMIGISDSYWGVLLWRGLSGFGSAMYGVSSMALLFAAAPPLLRGRANAVSSGGFVLGAMVGPALGGLFVAISIHAPFFFYTAALVVAAVVLQVGLPRTPAETRRVLREARTGLGDLARDRRYRAVILVNFTTGWQTYGVRSLLIPLFVVEVVGKPTAWAGIAFAIAATAQAACLPLAGWGTDRLGRRFMLLVGTGLTAAMSVGFAWNKSYVVLVVMMCVYSIGASATGSAAGAMLADTVPPSNSSGLAGYQMAGDIGSILGPLAAGAILDVASMSWAWLAGAVLILTATTLVWRTPKAVQPAAG